jgi:hypothetical protein
MALVSHLSHENKFILLGVYITEKVDLFPLACVLLDGCEPLGNSQEKCSIRSPAIRACDAAFLFRGSNPAKTLGKE